MSLFAGSVFKKGAKCVGGIERRLKEKNMVNVALCIGLQMHYLIRICGVTFNDRL